MIFEFEKWINNEKKLNIEAKSLFQESIICFRAGAYKASYVICYIGFLTSVQYIFLNAKKPQTLDEEKWTLLQSNARNEESWDKAIFEMLIRNDNAVFITNDDTKNMLKYYRTLRNCCAHNKSYKINQHNVLNFWSFIMQKHSSFAVGGSLNELIEKTRIHFNLLYTSKDKSFSDLADEIINTLSFTEIEEYLDYMLNDCTIPIGVYDNPDEIIMDEFDTILNELILKSNDTKKEKIKDWLISSQSEYSTNFIMKHPNIVNFIEFNPAIIRKSWKKLSSIDPYKIEAIYVLLKNELIPICEQDELASDLIEKCSIILLLIKPFLSEKLIFNTIFLDKFLMFLKKNVVDTYVEFKFANSKSRILEDFLKLDYRIKDFFENFYKIFKDNYHSPKDIINVITRFLLNNNQIKNDFLVIYSDIYFNEEYERFEHIEADI